MKNLKSLTTEQKEIGMVSVYSEMYVKSNGKSFKEGSEIILKHVDGREFLAEIETIAREWIEITTDDETFDVWLCNIASIDVAP